jgi:hypothetical protein
MKVFRTILLVALTATSLALVSGCATTNNDVSSIPWDRPQSWEGSGALGAFAPGLSH